VAKACPRALSPEVRGHAASMSQECVPNSILVGFQPDEGIHIKFQAKSPGSLRLGRPASMVSHHTPTFGTAGLSDAYDHLRLDVLEGDASLFTRGGRPGWRGA